MPGSVERLGVWLLGPGLAVGPFAVAAVGVVTGAVTTGAGVGVLTGAGVGAGAAGVVTTGAGAFSTPRGIPAGVRAVDGRGAELLSRGALAGAAG
ncbi:MAG TPA: hypothetical protein VHW01_31885 [Polyangiaceae bacterium]|nr:hypothetical protein [Polyangiaceae bacterium]